MEPDSERQQVQIPEKEANELAKRLRHDNSLKGVGLSVYAYVSDKGIRALHVACDKSLPGGKYESFDIRYKADTEVDKLAKNAIKRIRAQFVL